MFRKLRRPKNKEQRSYGKKTQIVLLAMIFISVSISLAGITAYVVGGGTVSFQAGPTGPDLSVENLFSQPTYPDINEYTTFYVTVNNLGKNITSYYSVYINFADGTSSSFECSSSNCFWKSGESRTFRVPHAYSNSGSFNISVNTYVAGDISSGNSQKSILVPVELPTALTINSNPQGSNIYFDNSFVGISPVTVQTTSGTHLVRAVKDGYESNATSTPYDISPGTSSINIYLTPLRGNIFVDSSPQGATIYLDGSIYWTTPSTLYGIPIGMHTISVVKTGYYPYNASVNVVYNQTVSVFATLTPIPTTTTTLLANGSILANSTPTGANVYVDGTFKGTSPILISPAQDGYRYIRFTKTGYLDNTTTVFVSSGQTVTAHGTLIQNQTVNATTTIISNTCSDSDGDNPNVTGTVSGYQAGVYQTRTDNCISSSITREWVCLNNGFYDKAYTCANGCSNGKCNQTNQTTTYYTCSDSDAGFNYNVKGTSFVSYYVNGQLQWTTNETDVCLSEGILKEFYCSGNSRSYTTYVCANSCSNGACLTQSSTTTISTTTTVSTCNPTACGAYGTICCPNSNNCIAWWQDNNNCGGCGIVCTGGTTCKLNIPGNYASGASCQP